MKKIIFHHPLPLNPNATSASGIRPMRMLEAFKSLGYEVDLVTGYSAERRAAIKSIKNKIKSGLFYSDIYWMFDSYDKNLSFLKSVAAKFAYKFELHFYKRYLAKLYLPSLEMGKYVPIVQSKIFAALPPGDEISEPVNIQINSSNHKKAYGFLRG